MTGISQHPPHDKDDKRGWRAGPPARPAAATRDLVGSGWIGGWVGGDGWEWLGGGDGWVVVMVGCGWVGGDGWEWLDWWLGGW